MSDENSREGTLSVEDAMNQLIGEPGANPDDEDQASQDEEVTDEADQDEPETDEAEEDDESAAQEDDAEDEEQEEPEVVQRFTVEINGKEQSVTLDDLRSGYMMKSDYTRKTQELAEARKRVEPLETQLKEALSYFAVPKEPEPDWADLAEKLEPRDFQKRQAEWHRSEKRQAEARELLDTITAAEHQRTAQEEGQKLLERLPEWRNPDVVKADTAEITSVAEEFGFAPEELNALMDHRQILVLRELAKLRRTRKAVTEKKQAKPQAKAEPVGRDRKRTDDSAQRDASARFKKSQNPNDAVAFLLARNRTT